MTTKRQVAKKVLINQINKGTYIKTAGWDPSYVLIGKEQVTIANVMGIIIDKQDKLLIIDDGTGNIPVRFFDNNEMPNMEIGQAVQVIGRVSEHNKTKFITGQAITKITIEWLKVRKQEVKNKEETKEETKIIAEPMNEVTQSYNIKDDLIEKIKQLDPGEGVEVTTLINGSQEKENAIKSLLEEGEIFEILPGRVKVLE